MFQPYIFNISSLNLDLDLSTKSSTIINSSTMNLPLMSLGFQHFLHRTKNGMSIIKTLQTQNEFYYIVNPFEYIIPDYEDSLEKISLLYFNIKSDNLKIKSQDFYKLWEIISFFDILDMDEMIYANINDKSGGFIQAIINYREKLELLEIYKNRVLQQDLRSLSPDDLELLYS